VNNPYQNCCQINFSLSEYGTSKTDGSCVPQKKRQGKQLIEFLQTQKQNRKKKEERRPSLLGDRRSYNTWNILGLKNRLKKT